MDNRGNPNYDHPSHKGPIGRVRQDNISERARKSFEEEVGGKGADHEPDGSHLGHHHYQGNIDNNAGQNF